MYPYLSVLFNRQERHGFPNSFRIIFLPPSHFSSPTIRSEDLAAFPTGRTEIPHFLNVRDFNSSRTPTRRRFYSTIFKGTYSADYQPPVTLCGFEMACSKSETRNKRLHCLFPAPFIFITLNTAIFDKIAKNRVLGSNFQLRN